MKNKIILLTGASGFLGSNIAKEIIANEAKLIVLVRTKSNLTRLMNLKDNLEIVNIDTISISEIFKKYKIDLVINAATSYGKKGETIEEIVNANYLFPLSLLLNSIDSGVKEFINIGTSLQPFVNEYSFTKHQFVEWLMFHKHKIKIKNVVLEYFYGPEDDSWKFVTMLFEKFKSNAPYIDFTSGEQKRNFIYIVDVVNALIKIIDNGCNKDQINFYHVKSSAIITIKELVYLCKKISKNSVTELNFGVVNNRIDEIKDPANDFMNLISLQNWHPKTSLIEGLEITWKYINEKNN
jgi:nucleoside-diphosphate-sugar epimerase